MERYSFRAKKFGEILVFYTEFLNMGRLVFSVNICDILSKNKNYETYLCEVLCKRHKILLPTSNATFSLPEKNLELVQNLITVSFPEHC